MFRNQNVRNRVNMKNVLVTGASGLLGSHVVRLLYLDKDFLPIPMVRTQEQANEWINLGLNQVCIAELTSSPIIIPKNLYAIVHTAAIAGDWVDKTETLKVNVEGTRQLIEAALQSTECKFFIHISTIGVYGHSPYTEATEDIKKYKKSSTYENSKIEAEKIIKKTYLANKKRMKFIILRPPSMYGEGDRHIIPKFKEYIQKGKFLFINKGTALYPVIHATDAATAVLLILKNETLQSGSIFHISDDTRITLHDFVKILADNLDLQLKFRSVPYWPAFIMSIFFELLGKLRGKEPFIFRKRIKYIGRSRHVNISKARQELGFNPVISAEIGIPRALKWLQTEEKALLTKKSTKSNIPFYLQHLLINHDETSR